MVELAPLILAVQGDLVFLNGQVEVPFDILQASSKEEEPGSIRVELQPGKSWQPSFSHRKLRKKTAEINKCN